MSLQPLTPPDAPTKPLAAFQETSANGDTMVESRPAVAATLAQRLGSLDDAAHEGLPARRRSSRLRWLVGTCLAGAILVGAAAVWFSLGGFDDPYKDLQAQPVERGKVILSIVDKGELEAARNTDIICQVRSRSQSSSIASSIKWLVEDGTKVKKGDLIVQLDDSGLKELLNSQQSAVAEKQSTLTQTQKEKEIVESQNKSNLQTAKNNVELFRLDLEKYLRGDLEQKRKDLEGRMTLADSDLIQWKEKVDWSRKMVKKGYISTSQAEADEAKLRNAEIALEKLKEEKRVLDSYEKKRTILDFENKLGQAETAYAVAQIEAMGKLAQADAKLQAALSVLKQEETKLRELSEDIDNSRIISPNDGMVVYYIPEFSRMGLSSQQSIIAIGESVRQGQKLMRIPDLRNMQVKVKVHEALVPRLRGDVTRSTGFSRRLYGTLATSLRGDSLITAMLAAPEFRKQFEDLEEEIVEQGLPAKIKISSLEKPLDGHVKSVSAVASSTDWMSSDVKVYPTVVSIDGNTEGLKPGMSAEVTILADELNDVLKIPVHAVLEVGTKRFCYVRTEGGVEKRNLVTGLNNNKFVEVKDGSELKEGDLIVQNPRALAERLGDLQSVYHDPGEGLKLNGKRPESATKDQPIEPVKSAAPPVAGQPNAPPSAGAPGAAQPGQPGQPGRRRGFGQGGQGDRPQMSAEDMQKRQQQMAQFVEQLKKAKPADRKAMIDKMIAESKEIPAERREQAKPFIIEMLKSQGVEIPD